MKPWLCGWPALLLAGAAWAQDDGLYALFEGEAAAAPAEVDVITLDAEPAPELAAPPPRRPQIEEIVVTAQKREQAIEDVPISLSVIDQNFIAEQGITDIREAMLFVPNVSVESAGFFVSPRVRGFSFNNNNKAFEPPVGIAHDGIPYTRIPYFTGALFDVNRIEVLRGPQGTTFGKNTTAGLIHIISNDPAEESRGYLDLQLGDLNRQRLEAAWGGPLIEGKLNLRVAGLSDEREGFVHNTTHAIVPSAIEKMRGQKREGGRVKLGLPDLWGSELKFTFERVRMLSLGVGVEILRSAPELRDVVRRYDPQADFTGGNFINSIDGPDFRDVHIETLHGEWRRDLGAWSLTAVGSHSVLEQDLAADVDFTPAPGLNIYGSDRSPTSTLELRVASPLFDGLFGLGGGSSELLAGVFWQHREIQDSLLQVELFLLPFLEITAGANADDLNSPGGLPLPPNISGPDQSVREQSSQFFGQRADTLAVFGQLEYHLAPRWTLQLGGRLGMEDKRASWVQVFDTPPPNTGLTATGLEEFTAAHGIEERQFQPKVSLNFQPRDGISLFAHWSRAFKGGGFNAFAFRGNEDELLYGPEQAEELGFDAKIKLLDGAAKLNISLYRMDIDDFQVLTREQQRTTVGLGISKVVNAATARAQGIEADLTMFLSRWAMLIATTGFNDTEYLDFPINECPADRPDTDGDYNQLTGEGDPRCDASGQPFAFAPRWNSTLTTLFRWPVGKLDLKAGFTIEHQTDQFLDVDLDPRKVQEDFFRYKASLGLESDRWSFKLIGENLSDEVTYIRQGDVLPGTFVGGTEPPRTLYGQFRWMF